MVGYVPPFDHQVLWDGHATIIDEIRSDFSGIPSAIACGVGGGGLLSGILQGLKTNNFINTKIFTCETRGAASFYQSYKQKKVVTLDKIDTIAKTLGAKTITSGLEPYLNDKNIEPVLFNDEQALSAATNFAKSHRMLVEPACGAALAVCQYHKEALEQLGLAINYNLK